MKAVINKLLLGLLVLLATASVAAAIDDPQALVRQTAENVLHEVTRHQGALRKDQSLIYTLVEDSVLPHFDFGRMSQSAMGRFWRRASDEQKAKITSEFQQLLVRTYAVALLGYAGQKIEYQTMHTDPKTGRVMVPTRISNSSGPSIPINYRLYKRDDGWKVYDVVIDGVSLIANYRGSFANQINRGGIDGLIDQLVQQNSKYSG